MPNEGHLKDVERQEAANEFASKAGWLHGIAQGKKRDNPHEAGSQQWWAWNNAYKKAKDFDAQMLRRRKYEDRQKGI